VAMIRFILIHNRQGKIRLAKWYNIISEDEKTKIKLEVHRLVAARDQRSLSNFIEYRNYKVIYKRYAGLYFSFCVDIKDNELGYLESIHFFVEILDAYFKNVCELDLVFNVSSIRSWW
jgi:AP-2 complex subunit sigma-1